jgi:hypothetical protein
MNKPIYLDLMLDGKYIGQLRYTKHGTPEIINGKVEQVHNIKDLEDFVFSQRPSLRGKNIRIISTNNRVYP